jgi:N-acetylmuramoyl-L-alanine amidase
MIKIYLDPGHGGTDPGAAANGIKEKDITLTLAKRIRDILASEYDEVAVKMSRSDDSSVSLKQRTDEANAWGANYYLSVHVNSGGGEGFETFIYTTTDSKTQDIQKAIHTEILKQIPGNQDRGMKKENFHVLRESHMSAILTENLFIDNAADATKLKGSIFLEKLARGHVNGLDHGLALKRKTAPPAAPTDGSLYKVQVGAFSDKSNADKLAEELKSKGYPVTIVKN